MATDRTARAQETREQEARYEYKPPSTLPSPNPVDGYGFRWCAAYVLGKEDPTNMSTKMREGWVPCKAVDYPELQLSANTKGEVEVGGLILCKAPVEMLEARTRYYQTQAAGQMESVNNSFMKENDPRMPILTPDMRQSVSRGRDTFGSGTK